MVNNATKIKKSNSYLSRQVIKEKRARYMPEKEPTEQILPFDISKSLLKNHVYYFACILTVHLMLKVQL
jgi:hypothetical protein